VGSSATSSCPREGGVPQPHLHPACPRVDAPSGHWVRVTAQLSRCAQPAASASDSLLLVLPLQQVRQLGLH